MRYNLALLYDSDNSLINSKGATALISDGRFTISVEDPPRTITVYLRDIAKMMAIEGLPAAVSEAEWTPIANLPPMHLEIELRDHNGEVSYGKYMGHGIYHVAGRLPLLGKWKPTSWRHKQTV